MPECKLRFLVPRFGGFSRYSPARRLATAEQSNHQAKMLIQPLKKAANGAHSGLDTMTDAAESDQLSAAWRVGILTRPVILRACNRIR